MAETQGRPRRTPTKPALWAVARRKARATKFGSPAGRWSQEKALRAQVYYRQKGGAWSDG